MTEAPSRFVLCDDATFNDFATRVLRQVDWILSSFEVEDASLLRRLHAMRHNVAMLTGDNAIALDSGAKIKQLAETPETRETSGMLDYPLVIARSSTHSNSGPEFDSAFTAAFKASLATLNWQLAEGSVRRTLRSLQVATPELLAKSEEQSLDPQALQSHSVDLFAAETMIEDRTFIKVIYPLKSQALPILSACIASHSGSPSEPKSDVVQ